MNEQAFKDPTKSFALRVLKRVDALPSSVKGRAVAGQLVRRGTSVAANYRAACRGRSRAEFAARPGAGEVEAEESAFWLELIADAGRIKPERVRPLLREANELVAMIAASGRTRARSEPPANRRSPIANRK